MKVLILTCNTGGGHTSCAKYIAEELNMNNIHADVYNYLELVGENIAHIIEKLYLDSTKGNGTIFKGVYRIGEIYNKSNIISPVYLLNKMAKEKISNFIKDNGYELTICTHLFPSMALTEIKKEENIKFINVATDYECIPFWNETNPDTFVIPSPKLTADFLNKGFAKNIILPIGIPVSTNFRLKKEKIDIPQDKEYILLTSGSMGFGNMKNLVDEILKEIKDYYLVVICGNNEKLKNVLKRIDNPNLIVVGFTKNMSAYMQNSKVIVTKPGGLTTSEVVTLHKPLIHMMPIPGVENYNANFFAKNKMSLKAQNISEVVECLKKLLANEKLQKTMIKNQKELIKENSCELLVKYIKDNYMKKSA